MISTSISFLKLYNSCDRSTENKLPYADSMMTLCAALQRQCSRALHCDNDNDEDKTTTSHSPLKTTIARRGQEVLRTRCSKRLRTIQQYLLWQATETSDLYKTSSQPRRLFYNREFIMESWSKQNMLRCIWALTRVDYIV